MLTLTIPPKRDPIARLTLLGCAALVCYAVFASATAPQQASAQSDNIILIATPTLPVFVPTQEPVAVQSVPTAVPDQFVSGVVEQPAPQVIYVEQPAPVYVQAEPEVIVQEVAPVVIQNTPVVTYQTAVPETHRELPSGGALVMTATPAIGAPGFADSFAAPDPNAKCAFVGCL
jgi:hypothetical protein